MFEASGQPIIVRIKKREVLPACDSGGRIARFVEAPVGMIECVNLVALAPYYRRCPIGRSVVDYDYFVTIDRLSESTIDRLAESSFVIISGDYGRNRNHHATFYTNGR